jgi:UDPglucose--hexose-1-phosphate uridylyltransferase
MCFSPRHDLAMSNMDVGSVRNVVDMWADQYSELSALNWVTHVQVFENRGKMMGPSNPHPHCQIWANESVPDIPAREEIALLEIKDAYSRCLLCDYVDLEESQNQRVTCSNDHFIAVVPFWAVWPYEIMLLSRAHVGSICMLGDAARQSLARIIQQVTAKYDNLFQTSFPYSMGFHQSPCDSREHPACHLHAHFYPPLLRSAAIRKFMVGYEMLAGPQRDITPEFAADHLRKVGDAPSRPREGE